MPWKRQEKDSGKGTGMAYNEHQQVFTEMEIDTLEELMNIAFGGAAAELAETIDIFVELSTPKMKPIEVCNLTDYISGQIKDFGECSIVEQFYRGDIDGAAFLIFPFGVERDFLSLFQEIFSWMTRELCTFASLKNTVNQGISNQSAYGHNQ